MERNVSAMCHELPFFWQKKSGHFLLPPPSSVLELQCSPEPNWKDLSNCEAKLTGKFYSAIHISKHSCDLFSFEKRSIHCFPVSCDS